MAEKNETYLLPGEVSVALSAGRPQFLEILEAQIRNGGRELPREQVADLLRLVRDLLADRAKAEDKITVLKRRLSEIESAAEKSLQSLVEVRRLISSMRTSEERPAEET